MKFLTTLLFIGALTFAASAQITNGVKISALASASTPLGGTELFALVQSGVTKSATIDQGQAKATAANLLTSNFFATVTASINSALLVVSNAANVASNNFQTVTAANAAADVSRSNAVAVIINSGDNATSNGVVALLGNYYLASNPTGYQTAAQVTATANGAAAAALSGVTNGGTASFTNLVYLAKILPTNDASTTPTVNFDVSAAALQKLYFTNSSGSQVSVTVNATNVLEGRSCSLLVKNITQAPGTFRQITFTVTGTSFNSGGATSFILLGGKYAIVNYYADDGTNLVWTASVSP
jgi:hypothetical protein